MGVNPLGRQAAGSSRGPPPTSSSWEGATSAGTTLPAVSDAPASRLVLLGVTAASRPTRRELARLLLRDGLDVQGRCSSADAERFVGADLFSSLTRRPALTDAAQADGSYPHLDASRQAAVVCVAPCRRQHPGQAGPRPRRQRPDPERLAHRRPAGRRAGHERALCGHHPATQENVETLRRRGHMVGPAQGEPRRGRVGPGPDERAARDPRKPIRARPSGGRRSRCAGGASWSPPAARGAAGRRPLPRQPLLRPDGRRAGRRGCRPRRAGHRARWRTPAPDPAAGEVVEVETTAELERETLARAADADVVAEGRRGRRLPASRAGRGQAPPGTGSWTLELEPSGGHRGRLGARPPPRGRAAGFAAEMGSDRVGPGPREKLPRKGDGRGSS